MSADFPDFENPPVTEVVCGITFEALKGFNAQHFGLFWQKLRSEYPLCQNVLPLGFLPARAEAEDEFPFPLPRIWFISKDRTTVIQLQNNKFLCNWRKMEEEKSYPRYNSIIKSFKRNLNIFQDFIKEENLGELKLTEYELSYINHISQGAGWHSIDQIKSLLPDLCWRTHEERFLPSPSRLAWTLSFPLPESKGQLNVKLNQGMRKKDNVPILILDLTARGAVTKNSLESLWESFDVAHKWIVFGFTDLTSWEVQESIWKRQK
jgi:uncharacterized protein (TIGR04255 family)